MPRKCGRRKLRLCTGIFCLFESATDQVQFQSGLLAGVAAQLLYFFRNEDAYKRRPTSQGAKDTILGLCYAALLLNIAATISAFMVIDKMGSLTLNGARMPPPQIGRYYGTHIGLLVKFGGNSNWGYMICHCESRVLRIQSGRCAIGSGSSHGANHKDGVLKGYAASMGVWCA